jgi:prepilin-type processing-associated H-X9-DG protein
MMDDNLVGYALNALDPETHREVEAYLQSNPEARRRLEVLRNAVDPLALDAGDVEPPPALSIRTLGRVAEYCCRDLPRAPADRVVRAPAAGRPLWRRADVLVAATLLLTAMGVAIPWLSHAHAQRCVTECQNNLRVFYEALKTYGDQHDNKLPNVAALQPPRNVAGLVAPILMDAGTLAPDANVGCPGNSKPRTCPLTLERLQALDPEGFKKQAQDLICCYAYSLGYRDESGYHGPAFKLEDGNHLVPIMADRPPRDPSTGNSANHGGDGQNVLFLDGHVRFCPTRTVGMNGDDIYLNRDGFQAAGLDWTDTVLGSSASSP